MEDVEQYTTTVRMILCCTPTYLIYPLDSADHRTMQKRGGAKWSTARRGHSRSNGQEIRGGADFTWITSEIKTGGGGEQCYATIFKK